MSSYLLQYYSLTKADNRNSQVAETLLSLDGAHSRLQSRARLLSPGRHGWQKALEKMVNASRNPFAAFSETSVTGSRTVVEYQIAYDVVNKTGAVRRKLDVVADTADYSRLGLEAAHHERMM